MLFCNAQKQKWLAWNEMHDFFIAHLLCSFLAPWKAKAFRIRPKEANLSKFVPELAGNFMFTDLY